MAYITWQAWLPANPTLGAAQVMSSFATYSVVTLIVITVESNVAGFTIGGGPGVANEPETLAILATVANQHYNVI
jgi:hypothetical protein